MTELEKIGEYACALSMPEFDHPICEHWIAEIKRQVAFDPADEIFLVGHSQGATAILRYLEKRGNDSKISGAILVSTPIEKTGNQDLDNFFQDPFNFETIRSNCEKFFVIHGDNDTSVPLTQGKHLANELKCDLIIVPNGGHLSGQEGWHSLPQCLDSLLRIMK